MGDGETALFRICVLHTDWILDGQAVERRTSVSAGLDYSFVLKYAVRVAVARSSETTCLSGPDQLARGSVRVGHAITMWSLWNRG